MESKKQLKEDDLFEKANPDFCRMVRQDMEQRKEKNEKKELDMETLKKKGNGFFKMNQFKKAIDLYKEALKINNLELPLLTNILISYYKDKNLEECKEYVERILFLYPENIKGNYYKGILLFNENLYEESMVYFMKSMNESNRKEVENYIDSCKVNIKITKDGNKQNGR